jgi:hypothetical protein
VGLKFEAFDQGEFEEAINQHDSKGPDQQNH